MAWDPAWERTFQENEWGKYPEESLVRFVARNFYKAHSRQEIKILEVGCGPGANLWYMAREGFSVYGIDGSVTAVERAKARLKEDVGLPDEKIHILQGDIVHIPFEDNSFNAIVDCEAVSANPYKDAQQIYKEMLRVCNIGGKCYSRMFADGTWGCPESGIAQEGPMAGKGYARITLREEIEPLMGGWHILAIDKEMRTVDGIDSNHWVQEWVVTAQK